jgi:predicted phage-related endonuclease
MRTRIIECEQRTPEWFAARAGRLTGSVADAVLAKLKSGGKPAARRDLLLQLAIEQLIGRPVEANGFISDAMQRGIDLEPAAFARYEAETGLVARKTGFIADEELMIGCSLDGDINGLRGILELKCPKSSTHVAYLKADRLPPDYVPQVLHNLWVTGAQWCDFVSFDDRLPEGLDFFRFRVERDELQVDAYAIAAREFLQEVEAEVAALTLLRGKP